MKFLPSPVRVIGIVGSEAAKFTPETEQRARRVIRQLIRGAEAVVSGKCHLGGIDTWAIEEAAKMGLSTIEKPALTYSWTAGYKPRNIQIAQASDKVVCITVSEWPANYTGMRFRYCYHCNTSEHVKSGGCWTVKYARGIGKLGEVIVL